MERSLFFFRSPGGHFTTRPPRLSLEDGVGWLVGCLTSQQHASVSQGLICSDKCTCCHTETEVAVPTFHFTQSQYTDARLTSPSTDPIMPGAWQGSHCSANFEVTDMTRPGKIPAQAGFEPGIFLSPGGHFTTRPPRLSLEKGKHWSYRLASGGPGVQFPGFLWDISGSSHISDLNWPSIGYPSRRLEIQGQQWDWLAWYLT